MDYKKTCEKFIKKGVSIIDINNTYIDDNVQIDVGTVIYPNVSIRGDSIIGKNNIIDITFLENDIPVQGNRYIIFKTFKNANQLLKIDNFLTF